MPELEFGQSSHEGTELVVSLGGKDWSIVIIVHQLRINGRSEEEEEQIQVVDVQCIRHYVESLEIDHSGDKDSIAHEVNQPTNGYERRQTVEVMLV